MGRCLLWFRLFSGRGLYDRWIPRPGESYRVCERVCVCVCLSVRSGATLALTYNEQAERDQNKEESRELLIYVSQVITKVS